MVRCTGEMAVSMYVYLAIVEQAMKAGRDVHRYQERAYAIALLARSMSRIGLGVVGELDEAISLEQFLKLVADGVECKFLRHSKDTGRPIKTVALCGGSAAEFLPDAVKAGADVYLTADVKYDLFFVDKGGIMIVDGGHWETEKCTIDIFYDIISEKIPTFAPQRTTEGVNPVNYFIANR